MYGRALLLLILYSAPLTAIAQSLLPTIHLTTDDGLPGQKVYNIIEDRQGFIWLATGGGLSRFHGDGFVNYQHDPAAPNSLSNNWVHDILEEADGTLWVATKSGLDRFDPRTEKFTHFTHHPDVPGSLAPNTGVRHLNKDKAGNLWLSTHGGGLQRKVPHEDRFQAFHLQDPSQIKSINSAYYVNTIGEWVEDKKDEQVLWFCTISNGLGKLDLRTGEIQTFNLKEGWTVSTHTVYSDREDEIWVGTWGEGLGRFTPSSGKWEFFLPHPELKSGTPVRSQNILLDLEPKNKEEFWLASDTDGLIVFNRSTGRFSFPTPDIDHAEELFVDKTGNLWVLGDGAHLIPAAAVKPPLFEHYTSDLQTILTDVFKPNKNELMMSWYEGSGVVVYTGGQKNVLPYHTPEGTTESLEVIDFLLSKEDTLFAIDLVSNTLLYLDRRRRSFRSYRPELFRHLQPLNRLVGMAEDAEGHLWLYTREGGLLKLPAARDTCQRYAGTAEDEIPKHCHIFDLNFGQDGMGWLATDSRGVLQFNPTNGKVVSVYDTASPPPFKLRDNMVNDVFQDREGMLWVGFEKAGFQHIPTNESMASYPEIIANKTITGTEVILEDEQKRIWLLAHNGLFLYDFRDSILRNVNRLLNIEHKYSNWENDLRLLETGEIAYTVKDELYVFDPAQVQIRATPPDMVFTDLQVLGGSNRRIRNINHWREITLPYQERFFSIGFSALDYANHSNTQYAYYLEGWDKQWNYVENDNTASYSNLAPGDYVFHVKGADGERVWNEAGVQLRIHVSSPWYWNSWTQIVYFILLTSLIYAFYRFHLNRRLALAETERLKSLDAFKNNLFTNITHEFRTPLTVIQGVNTHSDASTVDKATIQRNSQQLLDLVNQILDLAKLESGKLKPDFRQEDILPYLRYVTESFHSLALNQKINLNFYAYGDTLVMDYDPDKILKILSNLISNALKFTPEYGKVLVTARREKAKTGIECLCLRVKDTGPGIAPADVPHIFSRFHQADTGTTRSAEGVGIGLALVKELVTLLKGEIHVNSQPGEGSCFVVYLPISRTASQAENSLPVSSATQTLSEIEEQPLSDQKEDQPSLLIVEDNRDVIRYLTTCLRQDYKLRVAYDGEEGITVALKEVPDIIISDIMMPKVDGFELCRTLKQDPRTDHIPLILLTAKADLPSKLSGLEHGADAYLTKPFPEEELHIRLRQLLLIRERLRKKYQQSTFKGDAATGRQDAFVLKVKQYILEHLDDEDLGVNALSEAVHLERTQVYRKLKALTGMSATHYIRHIRLQKGQQLLKSTDETVTQIALRVGFKDLAAFSRTFSKIYGQSPTQFRRERSKKEQ